MGILRRLSLWSSQKGLYRREKRTRFACSKGVFMDSSRVLGSGIKSLMDRWLGWDFRGPDCVYIKKVKGVVVAYLLLYVDDMLLAGPSIKEVQKIKDELQSCFEMKDLGEAKKILGMDILRNRSSGELWLTQSKYIERVLKRFNMSNVKEAATPLSQSFKLSKSQAPKSKHESLEMDQIPYASVVGSIMYIMICTRPDLSHALSVTSRYMSDPGKEHWSALKWVLRYLKGSSSCGILFKRSSKMSQEAVVGYCDVDFATNLDNRKSQFGYLFTLFGLEVQPAECCDPLND